MADFKYDVFISYSHQNQDWVKNTLLPRLESAGLKVFIDYRDFEVGESAPDAMERAVKTSKQTIPVLSPDYLKSDWTKFENLMLQVIDPANQKRRLIPILIEKCKIPLRLGTFTYADFTKDIDLAWEKLFKALKVSTPKPSSSTVSPVLHDASHWHLAHPYPMPPNFTGRLAEREILSKWLNDDKEHPLLILRALGGFGKSALTWHWLTHDVDSKQWPNVVFWSFYEGDSSFENFLKDTLEYLKIEVSQNQHQQVESLIEVLKRPGTLLILDGFERALRAYSSMGAPYQGDEEPGLNDKDRECVNINAEYFLQGICVLLGIRSKVLMTTRITPIAIEEHGQSLQGCLERVLGGLSRGDAITFFEAQHIQGRHDEIEIACAAYGYHALTLRLVVGRILKDFDNPGDIVAAQKLRIDGDVKQHQHHVLEVSYNSLPAHEQKLLSTIACFRSPVEYKTLETIIDKKDALDANLHDLVDRGLLHFDQQNKKFDLHPIVRHYAYDRLTTPERIKTHERLVNYFEAVPKPAKVQTLEDLAPIIELYHHMVRAGNLDEAIKLFHDRINQPTYYQFGAYQLRIELLRALFLDGEDKPPHLKNETWQGWTLNGLANSYSLSGQPRRSVPLFEMQNVIQEKASDKKNLAIGLGNVAQIQLIIGALSAAERNVRRQIDLCREIADDFREAIGHQDLGHVLSYRGTWQEAETIHEKGIELARKENNKQIECVIMAYSAHRAFLMKNYSLAIEKGKIAKQLADIPFPGIGILPRDQIHAAWRLGAAYRANGELNKAEENLSKAISMCRQINMVVYEADILLEIARLRYDQKKTEEAKSLAEEALSITERCGYVLQGADVNLFLAQYALEQEKDKVKTKQYAEEAKKLATCDGPPYYYKVAYEEAERLLEKLRK